MTAGVSIGGGGAGVEALMKAGAPSTKQAGVTPKIQPGVAVGSASFAEQMVALRDAAKPGAGSLGGSERPDGDETPTMVPPHTSAVAAVPPVVTVHTAPTPPVIFKADSKVHGTLPVALETAAPASSVISARVGDAPLSEPPAAVGVLAAANVKAPLATSKSTTEAGVVAALPRVAAGAKAGLAPQVENKPIPAAQSALKTEPAKKANASAPNGSKLPAIDASGTPSAMDGASEIRVINMPPATVPIVLHVEIVDKADSSTDGAGALKEGAPGMGSKAVVTRSRDVKGPTGAGVVAVGNAHGSAPDAAVGVHPASDAAQGAVAASPGVLSALAVPGSTASGGSEAIRAMTVPETAAQTTPASGKTGEATLSTGVAAPHDSHGAPQAGGADYAAASEAHMLVSTPNVLEVGITGGAHGGLRVRAELEHTGEVTASLMASSAASASALHGQLGAISAYLKGEAVGVSSLAVTGAEKGASSQGFQSGGSTGGAASQASAGGSGGQPPGRESGAGRAAPSTWNAFSHPANAGSTGYAGSLVPAALVGTGVGGWLNVRV